MSNLTGRQIMLLVACALALVTVAVGIYGLVRGPGVTSTKPAEDRAVHVEVVGKPDDPVVTLQDRSLPHTADPIAYSRAVAESLFDWDTSAGLLPTDYTAAVLADAD